MAWIDQRGVKNAAQYRYIRFVGGRILQDAELNALQDTQELKDQTGWQAVFRPGAVINIGVAVSGTTLTLSPIDSALPMLLLINGTWEQIQPGTVTFPGTKTSGTDTLYANWVLWRVTKDGKYLGTAGCLLDASLSDSQTGEAVAERGQLQIQLAFDQSLSQELLDTVRMISKSTAGIPVLSFTWSPSGVSYTAQDIIAGGLLATAANSGFVKLSTGTAGGVAVSNDDARLSNARAPLDGSVTTTKVALPATDGGTDATTGANTVFADTTHGGVDSARSFWTTLRITVHDALNNVHTQLSTLASSITGLLSRVSTLEQKTGGDMTYHVGKALGKNVHPPTVTDPTGGFEHIGGVLDLAHGGNSANAPFANSTPMAFGSYAVSGDLLGGINQQGDYILNEGSPLRLQAMPNNIHLNSFSALVNYLSVLAAQVEALQSQVNSLSGH